ncbi:MAG TPA: ABC transporter ATP-binding protein [Burkholderiaceae bacterium]|nr:ABC transporter ATP-binding protein [Burkholderiaceae bacterium]
MSAAPTGATGATDALVARDVEASHGARRVLHGTSVAIPRGALTAIVGPNGAGKSTLLSVLAGLHRADRGEVRLDGRPIGAWTARERARRLAWLSQHGEADGDLPVREVALLGRLPRHGLFGAPDAADRAAADAALRELDADALAARPLRALSGGERQRVLLARVLAAGAPTLLLDEPAAHLDPPHRRVLVHALRRRAREGAAIAAVVHDLGLALAADRVVAMAAGRVVAEGAPGDAALRDALERTFDDAIRIVAVPGPDGAPRWVALQRD